jgi:hypothetical protein
MTDTPGSREEAMTVLAQLAGAFQRLCDSAVDEDLRSALTWPAYLAAVSLLGRDLERDEASLTPAGVEPPSRYQWFCILAGMRAWCERYDEARGLMPREYGGRRAARGDMEALAELAGDVRAMWNLFTAGAGGPRPPGQAPLGASSEVHSAPDDTGPQLRAVPASTSPPPPSMPSSARGAGTPSNPDPAQRCDDCDHPLSAHWTFSAQPCRWEGCKCLVFNAGPKGLRLLPLPAERKPVRLSRSLVEAYADAVGTLDVLAGWLHDEPSWSEERARKCLARLRGTATGRP